jgi:hypothetical protein
MKVMILTRFAKRGKRKVERGRGKGERGKGKGESLYVQ